MGDGTTSVVILAAELLKRANDLVRAKIHPTSIISGYRLAMREVCAVLLLYRGGRCFAYGRRIEVAALSARQQFQQQKYVHDSVNSRWL